LTDSDVSVCSRQYRNWPASGYVPPLCPPVGREGYLVPLLLVLRELFLGYRLLFFRGAFGVLLRLIPLHFSFRRSLCHGYYLIFSLGGAPGAFCGEVRLVFF